MKLTNRHHEAIQMMILDRYSRRQQSKQIAKQLGVHTMTVTAWKRDEEFLAEYEKQLNIYRNDFEDIRLADRKERVKVLSDMFDHIPEERVALRMKVLEQVRVEVGDDRIEVAHTHELIGPNTPPRASSYEEWLQQNEAMEAKALPVAIAEAPA
jgi:predicted DNA-binding protein YlxM (UPF0122 family)|tara:strand:+ start:515 stop:976 length:462 start_codon:yes stop_codon:yes gene_type:complete